MADLPLTRTCTILEMVDGTADEYGVPARTWTEAATEPCELQQTASAELTDDRQTDVGTWSLWLPPDAPLVSTSRVQVDGDTYTVDGPPQRLWDPFLGAWDHIEAHVKLVADVG